jgi:hypothetical protein
VWNKAFSVKSSLIKNINTYIIVLRASIIVICVISY